MTMRTSPPRSPRRPFRSHDTALGGPCTAPLYRELSQEWVRLQTCPTVQSTLAIWAVTEPALDGFTRPGQVCDAVDRADAAGKNGLLNALLRLFQSGQPLAGRILIQCMLPKLEKLAHSAEGDGAEERRHEAIACFWTVIASYPTARSGSVAGGLALDTLNLLIRHRRTHLEIPADPLTAWSDDKQVLFMAMDRGRMGQFDGVPGPDSSLTEIIGWAVHQGHLSGEDAAMLAGCYTADGYGFPVVAEQMGISEAALRKRCSRVVARLSAALRAATDQVWLSA